MRKFILALALCLGIIATPGAAHAADPGGILPPGVHPFIFCDHTQVPPIAWVFQFRTLHADAEGEHPVQGSLDSTNIYLKRGNLTEDKRCRQPGEAGPPGGPGVAGPQGPAGPAGPLGPEGPQGERGETGPEGSISAPDLNELIAAAVADGDLEGVEGPRGPAGSDGQDGTNGLTGPQGPQGERGPVGPQGPKGDKGDTLLASPTSNREAPPTQLNPGVGSAGGGGVVGTLPVTGGGGLLWIGAMMGTLGMWVSNGFRRKVKPEPAREVTLRIVSDTPVTELGADAKAVLYRLMTAEPGTPEAKLAAAILSDEELTPEHLNLLHPAPEMDKSA